jgi:hypothetical protein
MPCAPRRHIPGVNLHFYHSGNIPENGIIRSYIVSYLFQCLHRADKEVYSLYIFESNGFAVALPGLIQHVITNNYSTIIVHYY